MLWRRVFAGVLLIVTTCADAQDFQRLFLSADGIYPSRARMDMRMVNFEGGRDKESFEFTAYLSGSDKYLLVFTKPAAARGLLQLRTGAEIYEYNRRVNKVNKTSAESAFLNTAFSQEDVMNTTLSTLYVVQGGVAVDLSGKPAYRIRLAPRNTASTYKMIDVYVDRSSGQMVRRVYYSYTDEPVKELVVDNMELVGGVVRLLECTVHDLLAPGTGTRVTFSNVDPRAVVDDRMFDPNRLQYLN